MYYAPHLLQKLVKPAQELDDLGRPLRTTSDDCWTDICPCRCDKLSDMEIHNEDSHYYQAKYKVVCGMKSPDVHPDDMVRVMTGEEEKCRGKVTDTKKLNYLNYAEIYF